MEEEEILRKLLWIITYAGVAAAPGQNDETAVMAANTAVHRYVKAWGASPEEAP